MSITCLILIFFLVTGGDTKQIAQSLTPLESGVFIQSQSEKKIVTEKLVVSSGDTVTTDATGSALIEGGHSTYLDPLSSLVVREISGSTSILTLESGKLWARTQKVFEKGEFYEIETKNTRAVVRGTSFGVLLTDTQTTVLVTEGGVSVWQKDEKTAEIIPESEILIEAGEKAVITSAGIIKSNITQSDNSEWFLKYSTRRESGGDLEVVTDEGSDIISGISANIPENVPLYPNATINTIQESEQNNVKNISFSLSVHASLSEVNSWYREALKLNGWTLVSDKNVGGYILLKSTHKNLAVFMQAAHEASSGITTISQRVQIKEIVVQ